MKAKPKRMTVAQIQKRFDKVRWSPYTAAIKKTLVGYFDLIADVEQGASAWCVGYGSFRSCALCRAYAPWYASNSSGQQIKQCRRYCPLGTLQAGGGHVMPCCSGGFDKLYDALTRHVLVTIKRAARARLLEIAPLLLKFAEDHYMNEGA